MATYTGCICPSPTRQPDGSYDWAGVIRDDCSYHNAAKEHPSDHSIAWNCPTYYDGCNCKEIFATLRARVANLEGERNRLIEGYHISPFDSSHTCPGCIYEDGKLITLCELHKHIDSLNKCVAELEGNLGVVEVVEKQNEKAAEGLEKRIAELEGLILTRKECETIESWALAWRRSNSAGTRNYRLEDAHDAVADKINKQAKDFRTASPEGNFDNMEADGYVSPTELAQELAAECHGSTIPDGDGGMVCELRSQAHPDWYYRFEISGEGVVRPVLFRDCKIVFDGNPAKPPGDPETQAAIERAPSEDGVGT